MFQDEAGFGRINKPRYCWCFEGFRPTVPCHHIREYMYAYGAVDPISGDNLFLVLPECNSDWMYLYSKSLKQLHNFGDGRCEMAYVGDARNSEKYRNY